MRLGPTAAAILFGLVAGFQPAPARAVVSSQTTVSATVPALTGNLQLVGYAPVSSLVSFLSGTSLIGTTTADGQGLFDKTFTGLSAGPQTFSIYAVDTKGRTTLTISFTTSIINGLTLTLSGFLLPPTVATTRAAYPRPESAIAGGATRADATITAFFNSTPVSAQATADANGAWQVKLNQTLRLGRHTVAALVQDSAGTQSVTSQTVGFDVLLSADLNTDTRVGLIDFSILMFNYGRTDPPNLAADINDDTVIDLIDFSIMMFYWTGD